MLTSHEAQNVMTRRYAVTSLSRAQERSQHASCGRTMKCVTERGYNLTAVKYGQKVTSNSTELHH